MFWILLFMAVVILVMMFLSIIKTAYLSDKENEEFWRRYDEEKTEKAIRAARECEEYQSYKIY